MTDMEDLMKIRPSKFNNEAHKFSTELIIETLEYIDTYISKEVKLHHKTMNAGQLIHHLRNKTQRASNAFFRSKKSDFIKKTILLDSYNKLLSEKKVKENKFIPMVLMKKPSNDISGINQVTILTSPTPDGQNFSCKHDCFYCPNEPAHEGNNWTPQPRAYLSQETAVQRANRNKFDSYDQTDNRLESLRACGHKCDKLEFIIEGGTFTEYPKSYLKTFFRDFIYCSNTFFDDVKRPKLSLEEEININKHSTCKIIGICIETRPDAVLELDEDGIPWTQTLLMWGVTRIQLGVQHIDNSILKKVNRGHTIEKAIEAIRVLKDNCFKIDIHLMPDLPNSTPEKDKNMFDVVYQSPDIQPDQIKIYPCEVVPWTKIENWYKDGKYMPYGDDKKKMQDVLEYAMSTCPPWIRLPRVIRDIPDQYISGGIKCGNMRQVINDKFKEVSIESMDIRYREIGRHPEYTIDDARMFVRKYTASYGTEYFISFESADNKAIYGFTRLRIRKGEIKDQIYQHSLRNMGLIRELHVYGGVSKVNSSGEIMSMQHKGLGKQLIKKAQDISYFHNMKGTVVISGIGVRHYYERLGYTLENNYMVKRFVVDISSLYGICVILLAIIILYST
tara:strand:- start:767 stop:2617 length:1851 start_codon:yes stop_codon:yes gene_type:complete